VEGCAEGCTWPAAGEEEEEEVELERLQVVEE